MAIACLAVILLLPLGVMLLRTPDGTLEIDTDDDDVRVVVERGGELVKVQDARNATGGGYHSDGRVLVIVLN